MSSHPKPKNKRLNKYKYYWNKKFIESIDIFEKEWYTTIYVLFKVFQ